MKCNAKLIKDKASDEKISDDIKDKVTFYQETIDLYEVEMNAMQSIMIDKNFEHEKEKNPDSKYFQKIINDCDILNIKM